MARRVGLLGGTFDPPHIGHLSVAVHARDALQLDEILLVVAHDPWQKTVDGFVTGAVHRFEMVGLAVEGLDRVAVSDLELRRGGPTYSIDTVRAVAAAPDVDRPVLVVGADAANGLDTWHRAEELRDECAVAVAARPGHRLDLAASWDVTVFDSPLIDVSSTELRRRVRDGRSCDVLVPSAVVAYIATHGLYSG